MLAWHFVVHRLRFLRECGIAHYTARNDVYHSCFVERFNRRLKFRLQKFMTHKGLKSFSRAELIAALTKLIHSYNNRVHSSSGRKPIEVTAIISPKEQRSSKSLRWAHSWCPLQSRRLESQVTVYIDESSKQDNDTILS